MTSQKVKVIVIGDSTCGKTSLLRQFVDNRFDPSQDMTIGVDLGFKSVTLNNRLVKLQIWDTSGQEVFHNITRVYYRGAHVILLVYDITNERSYLHIKQWLDHIHNVWRDEYQPTILLVGNKSDIAYQRVIPRHEAEAFASRHGLLFTETSAKTGEGVEDSFLIPVLAFVRSHPLLTMEEGSALELETPDPGITITSGCCW
jgi:Ras-related protein Rab-2A